MPKTSYDAIEPLVKVHGKDPPLWVETLARLYDRRSEGVGCYVMISSQMIHTSNTDRLDSLIAWLQSARDWISANATKKEP